MIDVPAAELFGAAAAAAAAGATLGEIVRALRIHDHPCAPITPVCLARAAAPFEELRAAADRYTAREGKRPVVFLCNMGSLKDYKARADFSRAFFAAGGYEVAARGGFPNPRRRPRPFWNRKRAWR